MGFKNKLANWLINREMKAQNRRVSVFNLAQAKTAGVIWNCDDRSAYKLLVKNLNDNDIKTTGFCFSEQPVSIKGEAMFCKKDFSRLGLPKSENVNEFIQKEFDLLIDISLSETIEAQSVRALSMAHFKAGWSAAVPDYFDLTIEVGQRREPSFLAEQLIHYLNEINKN